MIIPNDPNSTSKVNVGRSEYILDSDDIYDIDGLLLPTDFTYVENVTEYKKCRKFCPTDIASNFENRKQNQPEDWEYHTKDVNYFIGRHGYRCPEFEDIDWNNSIVFFGCSNLFGVGIDEKDTVTGRVKDLTGYDTVNLGVGGSSIDYNVKNQVRLSEHGIKPKAVVNLWTGYDRLLEVVVDRNSNSPKMCHHGAWSLSANSMKIALNSGLWPEDNINKSVQNFVLTNLIHTDPNHSIFMARENRRTAKVLWKDIPHIELTYFEHTQKIFDIDLIKVIDRARDLMHPGSKTNDMVAKHIASLLQAQGL